jgi:hypothetical protein
MGFGCKTQGKEAAGDIFTPPPPHKRIDKKTQMQIATEEKMIRAILRKVTE